MKIATPLYICTDMDRPDLENFKSPAALSRFVLTTVIGLFLDLWSKQLAVANLKPGHRVIDFIDGWLRFEYTENKGAVFGLGQGQRLLFLTVSIAAIGFLSYLFACSGRRRFMQFVLGMLLAGVLGNMYDRIVFAHVRDMIHALPGRMWPGTRVEIFPWIFNVADSLLCVGVALMVLMSFFERSPKLHETEPEVTRSVAIDKPSPSPIRPDGGKR
jgi:lipoprotein signal peptidase